MTSGFCFDNGKLLYMVNTGSYDVSDDKECFKLSCRHHSVEGKVLDNNYKIMRADIEYKEGWNLSINFNENGKDEFRVYNVINK